MTAIAIDGSSYRELRLRQRELGVRIEVRNIGVITIKLDRTPLNAVGGKETEFAFADHALDLISTCPDGIETVQADPTASFVAVIRREVDIEADGKINVTERLVKLYVRNRLVINERDCAAMMHRLAPYIHDG